jgi:Heparan-alpha-glucosaminide N-acetyltransferase, catalytic
MWHIIGQVVEQPSRPSAGRLVFIDVLRLLAALQMIVGHTLDALLADPLRRGPGFTAWTFARGLTSTAFFCAAGFSFVISTRGPRAQGGRPRRIVRAGQLVVVGYLLRLPLGIAWGEPPARALAAFLLPDVLHCTAAALLGCEAIIAVFPRARSRAACALCLGGAALAAAGPIAGAPGSVCGSLRALVDPGCGAPFPMLPWLGFPLVALGLAFLCFDEGATGPRGAAVGGRLLLAAAALGLAACFAYGWPGQGTRFGLGLSLTKLALLLGLSALLAWLFAGRRLPALLTRLAGETLFLYAFHVPLLYAGHVGLRHVVGHRLGLGAALAASAALVTASLLGALGYRALVTALRRRGPGGTPRPQRPSPLG